MALVVLDASVVIGFLDPEDALHEASVAAISSRRHERLAIPASVYAEILVGPARVGDAAVRAVDDFLRDLAVEVRPITAGVARIAARMRAERGGLKLPDAFVLACGEEAAADVVLTADRRWTALADRVRLVGI